MCVQEVTISLHPFTPRLSDDYTSDQSNGWKMEHNKTEPDDQWSMGRTLKNCTQDLIPQVEQRRKCER